jgi:hypothetical protein
MNEQTFIQLLIEFGPAEFQGAMIWIPAPRRDGVRKESEVMEPIT